MTIKDDQERPLQDLRADFAAYGKSHWLYRLAVHQGLWALCQYRFARWARMHGSQPLKALEFMTRKATEVTTGISIDGAARIGPGLYIAHFGGIVIGGGVIIGRDCAISQGVTLGLATGRHTGSPTLEDRVYLGAGVKVLGNVTIGRHTSVGANAVVTRDLPPESVAAGVPARVLRAKDPHA